MLDMSVPNATAGVMGAVVIGNTPLGVVQNHHNGTLQLAASRVNPGNSYNRILFYETSAALSTLMVSSSGINFIAMSGTTFPDASQSGYGRNELEVVSLPNGHYRVAGAYLASPNGGPIVNRIYVVEYDQTGYPFSAIQTFDLPLDPISGVPCVPKGLEFSASGRYLYLTHHFAPYMEYIDLGATPAALHAMQVTASAQDFQDTQIELGYDGSMYFSGDNGTSIRLSCLKFPDSGPNSTNWLNNLTGPLSNVSVTLNKGCDVNNIQGLANYPANNWLRLLPDQIDGEVYSNLYNTASVTPNPVTICKGTCVNLNYSSTNNDPVNVSFWSGRGYGQAGPFTNGSLGSWCPSTTTTYTVTPQIPAGSGYCLTPTVVTVTVDPNISANADFGFNQTSFGAQPGCFIYHVTGQTFASNISEEWTVVQTSDQAGLIPISSWGPQTGGPTCNFQNSITPGQTAPFIFVYGNYYTVTHTVYSNCIPRTSISHYPGYHTANTTGISESNMDKSVFEIYPNPSTGMITLTDGETGFEKSKVNVIDVTGKVVYSLESGSEKELHLDLSGLAKGMYYVRIADANNFRIEKLVIQ
jgi:hypothetical protein